MNWYKTKTSSCYCSMALRPQDVCNVCANNNVRILKRINKHKSLEAIQAYINKRNKGE